MEIMVQKRNGNLEPFDPEKIVRVTTAAGLRPIDASELAQRVTRWIELHAKTNSTVTSIQIRDKVFKELEKVNKYASGLYAWYQNLKDKKYATKQTVQ